MVLSYVPNANIPRRAFSSITPFTYPDGITHLELLEKLRYYVTVILPESIEETLGEFDANITERLEAALAEVIARLEAQTEWVEGEISELRDEVNAAVEAVINNSIELQDPVMAGIVDNPDSQTGGLIRGLIHSEHVRRDEQGGFIHVDDIDGADQAKIQGAVDTIAAAGGGRVVFAARRYELSAPVDIPAVDGLQLVGIRGKTIIGRVAGSGSGSAFRIGENAVSGGYLTAEDRVSDFVVEGFTFDGGLTNIDQLPEVKARHQRGDVPHTPSPVFEWGDGVGSAVNIYANGASLVNSAGEDIVNDWPHVENVTIRDCDFIGISSLPIFIRGVEGFVTVENCLIRRCLDPGFVFCEDVRFVNNRSEYSMDNGVSLSRGCGSVIARGNYVFRPWFNGIWVGGFIQSPFANPTLKSAGGPRRAVVSDNVLIDCTEAGIYGVDFFGHATVANNIVDGVAPTWTSTNQGVGINFSPASSSFGSGFIYSLNISGNTLSNCQRGGIRANGVRNLTVTGNTIRNPGRRVQPNNNVPIEGSLSQNFGFTTGSGTNNVSPQNTVVIIGNSITDTRGEPAMHWPIYVSSQEQAEIFGNSSIGGTMPLTIRTRHETPTP